ERGGVAEEVGLADGEVGGEPVPLRVVVGGGGEPGEVGLQRPRARGPERAGEPPLAVGAGGPREARAAWAVTYAPAVGIPPRPSRAPRGAAGPRPGTGAPRDRGPGGGHRAGRRCRRPGRPPARPWRIG